MNAPARKPETASREVATTEEETVVNTMPLAQSASLAVSLARAEVDQQITTAHAFPRSIDKAVKNIMSLATLDDETAAECIYALPRGGKPIRGPSVRFAEIVQSQWGNNRVGARVVHVDRIERYVEAEGVFHDLETNAATTARVRRRISDSKGRLYNEDMITVTGNAACSIARRNAILGGIPKAVYRRAYAAVEDVIAGDVKTLVERRELALKAFAHFGVVPEQVFAALGVNGLEDVTLEHMATLIGMHASLKNGEATVEEMFRKEPAAAGTQPKDLAGKLDELAKAGEKQPAAEADGAKAETADAPVETAAADSADQPAEAIDTETGEVSQDAGESEAEAPQDAPTAEATAKADKPADQAQQQPEQQQEPPQPKNEAEYFKHAEAWIDAATNGEAAQAQWTREKKLREHCMVTVDNSRALKKKLDLRVAALKAKG